MMNGTATTLQPGQTSDKNVDTDFIVDNGKTTKVGPNNVTVDKNDNVNQTGFDWIPGNNHRPATDKERKGVDDIIKNPKKPCK